MTFDLAAPGAGIPQPTPEPFAEDCTKRVPREHHDFPPLDYTHDPGGKATCRKCGVTWYD